MTVNSYQQFALQGTTVELSKLINLQYIAKLLPALPKVKLCSLQAGGHVAKLRGRGIEFDQVRRYQAGDEIRRIDWKITARTFKPHTKLFHDERERPVYLLIDLRANMQFGTQVAFKSVIAMEIASILAWNVAIHGDKVGAIIVTGEHCIELRPKTRKHGVLPILQTLVSQQQFSEGALVDGLVHLRQVVTPGSLIIMCSDFYNLGEDFTRHFNRLSLHNEIISFHIYDSLEKQLPATGIYAVSDGVHKHYLNANDAKFKRDYQELFKTQYQKIQQLHEQQKSWLISMQTSDNIIETLLLALRQGGVHGRA